MSQSNAANLPFEYLVTNYVTDFSDSEMARIRHCINDQQYDIMNVDGFVLMLSNSFPPFIYISNLGKYVPLRTH